MTKIDCNTCHDFLPDLLLDSRPASPAIAEHLAGCQACAAELEELRATMALMDAWTAPEPSAYFDTRLHARLREEQAAAPDSLWQRLTSLFQLKGGRGLRPAMVGALGFAMLLGGGTAVTLLTQHGHTPAVASPTVDDLKIDDNNAQALEQMDLLDDSGAPNAEPQS
jgi:anti-sigma factor RsiW